MTITLSNRTTVLNNADQSIFWVFDTCSCTWAISNAFKHVYVLSQHFRCQCGFHHTAMDCQWFKVVCKALVRYQVRPPRKSWCLIAHGCQYNLTRTKMDTVLLFYPWQSFVGLGKLTIEKDTRLFWSTTFI